MGLPVRCPRHNGGKMRRRRVGRGKSALGRAKLRKEYRRKYCSKGKHHWRPVFSNKYHWNRKDVECEYCLRKKQYKYLTKDQREIVREIAKTLREAFEKVRSHQP